MEEVKQIIKKYKDVGAKTVSIIDVAEIIKLLQKEKEQLLIDGVSSRSIEFGKWLNSDCNVGRGLPMDSWVNFELGKVDTKEAYRHFCDLNGY